MRSSIAVFALATVTWLGGCDSSMVAMPNEVSTAQQAEPGGARIRVDRLRGWIWKLTSNGVVLQKPGEVRAVAMELPGWIVAGGSYACLPDLALGPKGEVLVTSNVIPTLWRINPETLAVSVHPVALEADGGRDVGFNVLEFSAQHGAYFAASVTHGTVWKINTALTEGEKVFAADRSQQLSERSQSCAIS